VKKKKVKILFKGGKRKKKKKEFVGVVVKALLVFYNINPTQTYMLHRQLTLSVSN